MKTLFVLAMLITSTFAQAETCKISLSSKLGVFLTKIDQAVEYGKGVGITNEYGYMLNTTKMNPDTEVEHVDVVKLNNDKSIPLNCPNTLIRNKQGTAIATETVCPIDHDQKLTVRCSIGGFALEL